jgi:hypothetical protein
MLTVTENGGIRSTKSSCSVKVTGKYTPVCSTLTSSHVHPEG